MPCDTLEYQWKRRQLRGRVRLLVRWSKYAGDFVYHCHLIEHGDMGMMRTLRIEGCQIIGDLNGDGTTNSDDLSYLLSNWTM